MTHSSMSVGARRAAGINDGLLRLSIGLESDRDLLGGLAKGFAAISEHSEEAWCFAER